MDFYNLKMERMPSGNIALYDAQSTQNVAVVFDPAGAPLLAAAPKMRATLYAALEAFEELKYLQQSTPESNVDFYTAQMDALQDRILRVLALAAGEAEPS